MDKKIIIIVACAFFSFGLTQIVATALQQNNVKGGQTQMVNGQAMQTSAASTRLLASNTATNVNPANDKLLFLGGTAIAKITSMANGQSNIGGNGGGQANLMQITLQDIQPDTTGLILQGSPVNSVFAASNDMIYSAASQVGTNNFDQQPRVLLMPMSAKSSVSRAQGYLMQSANYDQAAHTFTIKGSLLGMGNGQGAMSPMQLNERVQVMIDCNDDRGVLKSLTAAKYKINFPLAKK